MKTLRISLLPILIASGFFFQGCAGVLPGNDAVIVHAEQTITIGNDAFETFLKSEYQTHDAFCAVSPSACHEVHGFAENLKMKVPNGQDAAGNVIMSRQYKKWLQSAAHLKEVYQAGKTPDNKRNLQQILDTISAAVAEAQKYMIRLRAVKGP